MKQLLSLKNKIKDQYQRMPTIMWYITKFVLVFLALLILSGNIGFNAILSNFFFVVVFSAVCAFIPERLMLLSLLAYTVVQVFSLTTGLGVLACIFFLIMYFIYFRFDEKTGYTMILVPLLCMLRLPILIPLILAVVGTSGSVVGCLLGVFSYYFLNYLRMHTAVFQGLTDNSEITKMSMAVNGVFSYKEMWYTLVCVAIVFFITFFLKKINVNQSNLVAISIGAGSYLILILVSNLIFGAISTYKILWLVLGSVISCILAMLITSAILPLDYSRTEIMEFEDDEYKYYVRAVPKVSVSRESVKIKRIYSRKRHDTARGKENEQ